MSLPPARWCPPGTERIREASSAFRARVLRPVRRLDEPRFERVPGRKAFAYDDDTYRKMVNHAHTYRCRDGWSYRQILAAIQDQGVPASLGGVHRAIHG